MLEGRIVLRTLIVLIIAYIVAGWLFVGLPRAECTSEQRARDASQCGVGAIIKQSLLWPLELSR